MGKKWKAAEGTRRGQTLRPARGLELVKRTAYAKFDETVEMAFRLGVDPKRSDQMVRGFGGVAARDRQEARSAGICQRR